MQLTTDLLEFCVLANLKKEDKYGYLLTQSMQNVINISESTLYPILRRLMKKGFLEAYDSNYDGRNRRYYKISEEGIKYFNELVISWEKLKNDIDGFLKEYDGNE